MNIQHYKTSIWEDAAFYKQPVRGRRRSRALGTAKYILFRRCITGMSLRLVPPG